MALRWRDVDLAAGELHVNAPTTRKRASTSSRSRGGPPPRTHRGRPARPPAGARARARGGRAPRRSSSATARAPFRYGAMIARARRRLGKVEARADRPARGPAHRGLGDDRGGREREGALASSSGHSSITITLDRYGHLLPGSWPKRPRCSTRISTVLAGLLAGQRRSRCKSGIRSGLENRSGRLRPARVRISPPPPSKPESFLV